LKIQDLSKLLCFLLFVLIGEKCFSQNLIPDPSISFNDTAGILKNYNLAQSVSWGYYVETKNKYWNNSIAKGGGGVVSSNYTEFIEAHWFHQGGSYKVDNRRHYDSTEYFRYLTLYSDHKDYLRFRPVDFPSQNSTQYFSDVFFCELSKPLVKDSVYKIQMWVLPPEFLEIPSIQIYLSDKKLMSVAKIKDGKNANRVDLYSPDSSMLINKVTSIKEVGSDTAVQFYYSGWDLKFLDKWICISNTYKAVGGERFFYIGNINSFKYTAYVFNTWLLSFHRHELVPLKKRIGLYKTYEYQSYVGLNRTDFMLDDISVCQIKQ